MSLPASWIDKIFERCTLVYGRDFLARWEGLDIQTVKDDWAEHLAGFEQRGGSAIGYALEHLPERPPSVVEFARIARGGPFMTPGQESLPPAKVRGPNEAERAALRAMAEDIRKGQFFAKPDRRWAYALLARHQSGEHEATQTALEMAREAIASDPERFNQ